MRATTSLLMFSLAFGPVLGCQVFDPSLLPPDPEDTNGVQDEPPPSECGHQPPPRPEASDPGEDVGFLLFALRDVVLDQSVGDVWREIGYDLDCYNTTSREAAVEDGHECVPEAELSNMPEGGWTVESPPRVAIDGNEGIDNVFGGQFFPFVEQTLGLIMSEHFGPETGNTFQSVAREWQDAGRGTVLIGVHNWNGQANQTPMNVWIAQAAGGTPCEHADDVVFNEEGFLVYPEGHANAGDPAPEPLWQGDDCWWLRDDAFTPGRTPPEPAQLDDLAFIADHKAVIRLVDRVPIQFFAGPVGANVLLTNAVATAEIQGDPSDTSSLRLVDALVAGRWSTNALTESGPHVGVCPGSDEQDTLTAQLDARADLRSSRDDPHLLNQRCNAISMGVLFEEGVPGHLAGGDPDTFEGSIGQGPPLPDWCDEEEEGEGGEG